MNMNLNFLLFQIDSGSQKLFDVKFQKAESADIAEMDANGNFSLIEHACCQKLTLFILCTIS